MAGEPDQELRIPRKEYAYKANTEFGRDEEDNYYRLEEWANHHTHPGGVDSGEEIFTDPGLFWAEVSAAVYDPVTDTWANKASPPNHVRGAVGSYLTDFKNSVFCAGGFNTSTTSTARLQEYDFISNTWNVLTSMANARRWPAEGDSLEGLLPVAGGYDSGLLSVFEVYDPTTDTWTTKASLPSARDQSAGAVYGGKFYVYAGRNDDLAFVYDPTSDTWSNITVLPVALVECSAMVLGDFIYITGGRDGSTRVDTNYQYDPATDTYTTKAAMPAGRDSHRTAGVDGLGYLCNGFVGGAYVDDLLEYDPVANTWTSLTPCPSAVQDPIASVFETSF